MPAAVSLLPLGVRFMTFDERLRRVAELELPGLVASFDSLAAIGDDFPEREQGKPSEREGF